MGCPGLTNVAPPGLCLFILYHFRGFTPPATSFRPFGTRGKCGQSQGLTPPLACQGRISSRLLLIHGFADVDDSGQSPQCEQNVTRSLIHDQQTCRR